MIAEIATGEDGKKAIAAGWKFSHRKTVAQTARLFNLGDEKPQSLLELTVNLPLAATTGWYTHKSRGRGPEQEHHIDLQEQWNLD